ncbi:MAG: hypothetical protein ABSB49_09835 [Polyangia bacterium]
MTGNILADFRAVIAERGLEPDDVIADGELHRCRTSDGKHGSRNGAYLLHMDGVPAGGFQNWKDGQGWQDWCSKRKDELSRAEWKAHLARVAADKKRRVEKLALAHAEAAKLAQQIWSESAPCE